MKRNRHLTISDFSGAIVWSYTRVSSKEQFLKNGSIETQVKRLKTCANENGLNITREFDAEYESSKRVNTQKTLNELLGAIKKTSKSKRPQIILIWSPSRFGRAGSEHIELFVSLRRKYNVFLYSVSTGHNTFTERSENEFSTQLLYAQKENFNRQDVIIPGMINVIEKGKFLGKAPRGYDHYGPRVKDPTKVQAKQEIKLNDDGLLIKEAFQLKLYRNYTDSEILDYLKSEGLYIPKQSLNAMWSNPFYAGFFTNSLVPNKEIKGHWTPIITRKEFDLLQQNIKGASDQIGIPKINGRVETPLIPKFLVCDDCNTNMTSYKNKRKQILYYKCSSCNRTVNANTRKKSLTAGMHQQFAMTLETLKLSKSFQKLFSKQLEKIIESEISSISDIKRQLSSEINKLQEQYDKMEFRYATDEISKEIFEKHGSRLKEQIEIKKRSMLTLPTKMSNHKKVMKDFLKISENPGQFYESLEYQNKRVFQNILFPEGFRFSMKNKECRTSKLNILFDLTSSFSKTYNTKKEKTQTQKVLESHLVEHNIHIVIVLHENPGSDKARGHIGTELMNKAETVIALQVDKYDDDVSIVSAGFCRNKSFQPFAIRITDDGLPEIIEDYNIEMKSKKKGFDVLTLNPADKYQVLKEVFENGVGFQHTELVNQIKVVLDNKYGGTKGKGQSKIKQLITQSKNEGWLTQNGNRQPYELGILSV